MEITIKLENQDITKTGLLDLVKALQEVASEDAAKAEEPKAKRTSSKKPAKEAAPKAAPVAENEASVAEEPKEVPATPEEPAIPEEPEKEPKDPEKPKAKVIDIAEMKKRVMAVKDKDSSKWPSIKALIGEYGGMLSKIPEDKREEFLLAVEAV